jgi:hypothetical protein
MPIQIPFGPQVPYWINYIDMGEKIHLIDKYRSPTKKLIDMLVPADIQHTDRHHLPVDFYALRAQNA